MLIASLGGGFVDTSYSLKVTTDCLGDFGPVKTCHQCKFEKILHFKWNCPPRGRAFTRVLLVPGFIPVPGTSVSSLRPCHNTRNFLKSCKTFILVPELLFVLSDIHTGTRKFCEFCIQYPGYGYSIFRTRPELM